MSPKLWFRLLGLSCLVMAIGLALSGCGRKVPDAKTALTEDGSRSAGQGQHPREKGGSGRKYALLVGVRAYDHRKLTDLEFTENDAEAMAAVLTKGKYDEVVVLTTTRGEKDATKKPTKANIEAELKRLLKKVTKHDVVLIGLAGHGVQYEVKLDGKKRDESFFCPADTKLIADDNFDKLAETMLPFRTLFEQLDDSGAGSRLLLIDACRNEVGTSRNADTDAMPRPTKGTAALFSCKGGERAFKSAKLGKGHGVFFYHVIEALEGAAKSEDGEVTWDDLTRHVRRAVVKSVPKVIGGGARQTPHLMANVEGDPVLVRIEIVKGFLDKDGKNSIGMKFVLVKKGTFTMGSPKGEKDRGTDEDEHPVEITKDFYLGAHEVTQKQYKAIVGTNPSYFSADGKGADKVKGMDTDDFPVENVSWEDAQAFLKKLNARAAEVKNRVTYRLPTEAEWEYACRGGVSSSNKPFHFKSPSDSLGDGQANFYSTYPYGDGKKGDLLSRTNTVGKNGEANKLGLYDMHGNVWEWCSDWYGSDYYGKSPIKDPPGAENGSDRVIRGGSWNTDGQYCRSAFRLICTPSYRNFNIGFRVAAVPHE